MIAFLTLLGIHILSQDAKVVVFKHELRWTDESRFPNYFQLPAIKDSVFLNARLDLMNVLKVNEIIFPDEIAYNIFTGFGKQKVEMPKSKNGSKYEVGIFSFITRATSGWAMFWNFRVIVNSSGKTLIDKEVRHELEYFNPSGYQTSIRWMYPDEFSKIFGRLFKECIGILPANNDKIVLGSIDEMENRLLSNFPDLKKFTFKINGAWKNGGNFSARLESDHDTVLHLSHTTGFTWEIAAPTFSGLLADLFTSTTGIDVLFEQKVYGQQNGTNTYSDGSRDAMRMRWIEFETRSVKDPEGFIREVSGPVTVEIFNEKAQSGYFLFTRQRILNSTSQTKEKLDLFTGIKTTNSLGIESINRLEGMISNKKTMAIYNENSGYIIIKADNDVIAAMLVQNTNPDNKEISQQKMSENKKWVTSSSQNITKPKMNDEKKIEWYPVYISENADKETMKNCLKILICMFIGMGIQ